MPRIALIIESEHRAQAGHLGDAAQARGFELVRMQVDGNAAAFDDLPDPEIVIVTGSHEHWWERDDHPHLQRELAWIQGCIASQTPILGACFGGQALALALGGEVKPLGFTEIGWVKLETTRPELIPAGPWLAWHSDYFALPDGAEPLARNDVCVHAFRHGPHLGLQFHPEVGPDLLGHWIDEVPEGTDPDQLIADARRHATAARERAFDLFDVFLSLGQTQ